MHCVSRMLPALSRRADEAAGFFGALNLGKYADGVDFAKMEEKGGVGFCVFRNQQQTKIRGKKRKTHSNLSLLWVILPNSGPEQIMKKKKGVKGKKNGEIRLKRRRLGRNSNILVCIYPPCSNLFVTSSIAARASSILGPKKKNENLS